MDMTGALEDVVTLRIQVVVEIQTVSLHFRPVNPFVKQVLYQDLALESLGKGMLVEMLRYQKHRNLLRVINRSL